MEKYTKSDGFIDIPKILDAGIAYELFPGILKNVEEIRKVDFPLFDENGRVYLDSAATSQEPQTVKDRIHEYRRKNIRGSNHSKNSVEARSAQNEFNRAKENIQDFFNASNYTTAFTSGTTCTSNYIATRFPLKKNDLLLLTEMEHNSQILTARNVAKRVGADVEYLTINKEGRLDLNHLEKIIKKRKHGKVLMNLIHASNVSGVINPVKEIREIVGSENYIYLDIAQSAGHISIDLNALNPDFAGVSSHKMYGPMGIGAVFINRKSEDILETQISGGSAVEMTSKYFDVPSKPPERFEPGTQDIEGAIEWSYAVEYIKQIGMKNIERHDNELGKYFIGELSKIKGLNILGPLDFENRTAIVTFHQGSFLKKNYDEIAKKLDAKGISVRDGCFCSHIYTAKLMGVPELVHEGRTGLMELGVSKEMLKLPGSVRASFAFYNNLNDAYKTILAIR